MSNSSHTVWTTIPNTHPHILPRNWCPFLIIEILNKTLTCVLKQRCSTGKTETNYFNFNDVDWGLLYWPPFYFKFLSQSSIIIIIIIIIILFFISMAHQHKTAGMKIKLSKIKMVAMVSHLVTTVLWKETTFPRWRAMDKRLKRNVVSMVSSVMAVMRLPISCVNSMAMLCMCQLSPWQMDRKCECWPI